MTIFDEAGRRFERTKRAVLGSDDPAYVCRACEERLHDESEYCPHCGEPAVEAVD
ncbi:MAG: hypothetical protein ABEH64_02850 [Salinirussus sp.]